MDVDEIFELARSGDMDGLVKAMEGRPESDWHIKDDEEQTLLHAACQGTNTDLIDFLIKEKKLDVNFRADFGITPFHSACESGHIAVVQHLYGTGKVKRNIRRGSASILAFERGHSELQMFLKQREEERGDDHTENSQDLDEDEAVEQVESTENL